MRRGGPIVKHDSASSDLPDQMDALGQLMHRGESNPRTRSGILGVQILDTTPDWDRFLATFDDASRRALRLRQKVVVPTLPTAAPRWVVDADFDLRFHVRRTHVAGEGTLRDVLDLAEVGVQSPLDICRPLWTVTLVEGLTKRRSAVLLHLSHAMTDGVGGVEMFSHMFDAERDPSPKSPAPLPIPDDLTPNDLMRAGINGLPGAIIGRVRGAVSGTVQILGQVIRDPPSAVSGVLDYATSTTRVMASVAEPSPLLRCRSISTRTEAFDFELADLRTAAKAAGGSVNDAYLAGLCGGLRRYHEELGAPIATLPMAVPVNLRSEADPGGGNQFAGVMLPAPVGEADPAARIQAIRAQMIQRRDEPAIDILGTIAPIISRVPASIVEAVATSSVNVADVQASNVPMYSQDIYIAGAKVLRQYGLGPLPGVAMMVILVSLAGHCTMTVRYDRASVTQEHVFARCLKEGLDEVFALAGPATRRSVLVSAVESP